jgi:hypothetical protein
MTARSKLSAVDARSKEATANHQTEIAEAFPRFKIKGGIAT